MHNNFYSWKGVFGASITGVSSVTAKVREGRNWNSKIAPRRRWRQRFVGVENCFIHNYRFSCDSDKREELHFTIFAIDSSIKSIRSPRCRISFSSAKTLAQKKKKIRQFVCFAMCIPFPIRKRHEIFFRSCLYSSLFLFFFRSRVKQMCECAAEKKWGKI